MFVDESTTHGVLSMNFKGYHGSGTSIPSYEFAKNGGWYLKPGDGSGFGYYREPLPNTIRLAGDRSAVYMIIGNSGSVSSQ